jgi:hypothetical protein
VSANIETITLTGKDEADLNRKQWDWQTNGPTDVVIVEQHPDELLPITMNARPRSPKLKPQTDSADESTITAATDRRRSE